MSTVSTGHQMSDFINRQMGLIGQVLWFVRLMISLGFDTIVDRRSEKQISLPLAVHVEIVELRFN